jgi:hypothetical protein
MRETDHRHGDGGVSTGEPEALRSYVGSELNKTTSPTLRRRVRSVVESVVEAGHIYDVEVAVHFGETDKTHLCVRPGDGEQWWVGGENATLSAHAILGPQGQPQRLDVTDRTTTPRSERDRAETNWERFMDYINTHANDAHEQTTQTTTANAEVSD